MTPDVSRCGPCCKQVQLGAEKAFVGFQTLKPGQLETGREPKFELDLLVAADGRMLWACALNERTPVDWISGVPIWFRPTIVARATGAAMQQPRIAASNGILSLARKRNGRDIGNINGRWLAAGRDPSVPSPFCHAYGRQ